MQEHDHNIDLLIDVRYVPVINDYLRLAQTYISTAPDNFGNTILVSYGHFFANALQHARKVYPGDWANSIYVARSIDDAYTMWEELRIQSDRH